jgi:perosamine synthetase
MKTFFSHGMSEERYVHNLLGTNYRMTNIQAGFLYDQMNDIEHILSLKRTVFQRYDKLLSELLRSKDIETLATEFGTVKSHWMYPIRVCNTEYSKIETFLSYKNIQVRPFFYDMRRHAHLKALSYHEDEVADTTCCGILLPSYPELTAEDQEYIVACLTEWVSLNSALR